MFQTKYCVPRPASPYKGPNTQFSANISKSVTSSGMDDSASESPHFPSSPASPNQTAPDKVEKSLSAIGHLSIDEDVEMAQAGPLACEEDSYFRIGLDTIDDDTFKKLVDKYSENKKYRKFFLIDIPGNKEKYQRLIKDIYTEFYSETDSSEEALPQQIEGDLFDNLMNYCWSKVEANLEKKHIKLDDEMNELIYNNLSKRMFVLFRTRGEEVCSLIEDSLKSF